MMTKKFIPCIYLYQGKAVCEPEKKDVVNPDPVALAKEYAGCGCDAILVFDLSEEDKEKEEALDVIRQICSEAAVPVIGSCRIHKMEDVKKLLYAGCSQAVLDYDDESNRELTKEVSLKFGADRLIAETGSSQVIGENAGLLETYLSGVLLKEPAQLKSALPLCPIPVYSMLPEISLDKIIEILQQDGVGGIAGKLVNENVTQIEALKKLCGDNGLETEERRVAHAWEEFRCNSDGLVPVVVQDYKTDAVLMVAYMNEEAYYTTLDTGRMTYYSRSRRQLWVKGETSGHYQYVHSLYADCDMDTILARVEQVGPACHTGSYSCFFQELVTVKEHEMRHDPMHVLEDVYSVILDRREHPKEGSYTNYLFDKGIDKILKKLGEESTEIVIASKNPNPNEIKYEICDYLYHLMVLMADKGITWEEIMEELAKR